MTETDRRPAVVPRESEAAAVSALLSAALTHPAGLVVTGEAGIGKTTLWLSGCDDAARQGFRVLTARGDPGEIRLAFAAVADLLANVEQDVIDRLPPVQRRTLNRILLRGNDGPALDERAAAAAFQGVVQHLASEAPVLIAIDDVQWLDTSSAAAVRFAARRLSGAVGILATARTGEPSTTDVASSLTMQRPDAVARIQMSALTLGGLHALVSSRLGRVLPRPTMTRIYEISGGNPLYALELAHAVAAGQDIEHQLPDTLAAFVRARVQDLDAETARLLLAAASTPSPTVELIAKATGMSEYSVARLLESGGAAHIVTITGNRIRFTHPLLATGVYAGSAPIVRREMHRRLADCVDAPELRARHLASAAVSGDEATLEALDVAAALTRSRGAPAAAAELLDLAIGLGGDTPVRRIMAAQHHFEAGSIAAARTRLDGMVAQIPPGPLQALAVMLQGAVDGYDGSFTAAVESLRAGVDQLGDNPGLRLQGLMLLAPATGILGRMAEAVALAREAVQCADQLDKPALRSQARAVYLNISLVFGMGIDQAMLDDALRWQGDAKPVSANMRADAIAALADSWHGRLDRAERGMRIVKQQCADRGSEIDGLWVDNHLTMIHVWAGDYERAGLVAAEQERRAEQLGGHHAQLFALTCRAAVDAYTGQADRARAAAIAAIDIANDTGGHWLAIHPTITLGFVEVSLGNYQAALKVYAPLLESFSPEYVREIVSDGWLPDAIEALTSVDRIDDAERLVTALHDNGTRAGRAWMLATAGRGRALCLAARGDLAAAEDAAAAALAHHRGLPMPFERARTQLVLGQLQRRRRRRQQAVPTLTEALRTFSDIGAPLWAERASAELARIGGAAERLRPGLTRAEERIARRAAAGLSNKEIAAEQFLAVKTVETALSSAYRKLGIRSRAQLHAHLDGTESTP